MMLRRVTLIRRRVTSLTIIIARRINKIRRTGRMLIIRRIIRIRR